MTELRSIPVFNRGLSTLNVCLEPEGDYIELEAGASLEIRYLIKGHVEPGIELEVEDCSLTIHCMVSKEVWQNGQQLR